MTRIGIALVVAVLTAAGVRAEGLPSILSEEGQAFLVDYGRWKAMPILSQRLAQRRAGTNRRSGRFCCPRWCRGWASGMRGRRSGGWLSSEPKLC